MVFLDPNPILLSFSLTWPLIVAVLVFAVALFAAPKALERWRPSKSRTVDLVSGGAALLVALIAYAIALVALPDRALTGPVDVRWYGVFAALMFLGVYLATPWLAKRKFGDDDTVFWQNAVIVSLVTGLIGARLLHVILAWNYYAAHPLESFEVWKGGLTTHGALPTALAGLWIYGRMHGRHVLDITDTIVVPFSFSLSLGRIGNIMNSEILGDPCPGPWPGCPFSFSFARDPTGVAIPRVPVQFYAIVQNIVIGSATAALYLTTKTRGLATAGWLTLYGVLRFIVEFYRAEPLFFGPFDMVQTFSIPIVLGIAAWFVWLLVKERRIEEREPDAA